MTRVKTTIYPIGDLHLEFDEVRLPTSEADIIVLCGDIHSGSRGLQWAREAFAGRRVIYVAGNHEYYGGCLPRVTEALDRDADGETVHFLENRGLVVDGIRFLGCALWTDFELFGLEERQHCMRTVSDLMNDYRLIRMSPEDRRLQPTDTLRLHHISRHWIEEMLATPFDGPTVVVTHHAPSVRSLRRIHWEDPASAGFASSLESLIGRHAIDLWIHGHTHYCVDYVLNGTRILSNQRGYPDIPDPEFRPDLLIRL